MSDNQIHSINLSLSTLCNANCVFCPSQRGSPGAAKNMDMSLVEKIVDEVATDPRLSNVRRFELSENGEWLMNKRALDCARAIKRMLPTVRVETGTNFALWTRDISEQVFEEALVDSIFVDMDGADAIHYKATKGIDLERTETNIKHFLEMREKYGHRVSLKVRILTYRGYHDAIKNGLGVSPLKIGDKPLRLKDDYQEINKKWRPMLKDYDRIVRVRGVYGWCERPQFDPAGIVHHRYRCPILHRVKREAFIAPDGTWYICCFDSSNEVQLGNVAEESLADVATGHRRQDLIHKLERREFMEIGGPCSTVNCCRTIYPSPIVSFAAQLKPRLGRAKNWGLRKIGYEVREW